MDKTLHDLGGIVLQGLPTFFLVLILAFFVKILYLNPLDKVLAERFRLTEGARKAAEESFKNADSKIAEYQAALNKARNEIYQEQAGFLSKLHSEQAEQTQKVRAEGEQTLAAVRLSLAQETASAKENLGAQSEILAGQIADAILRAGGLYNVAGLKRFAVGLMLVAAPLLAEEAGGAEKPSMGIWKWLNFAILAGLLGYMAVKQGGAAFAARTKEIAEGLAAGERAKADADKRAAEVSARLANLETEITALRSQAREEREREAERIRKDAASEVERLQHQIAMEVETAGKQARLEVKQFAARMAIDLAEKKVRARMSPEVEASLLDSFVGGFK